MAIWLDDLLEQIATSMVLADSGTETGKRLSFIIVDNAVEFLMKAYVESEAQLVGSGKAISKQDWDNRKQSFFKVLDFVFNQFPSITASKTDILSFHNVRNDLYHEGKPLSVGANTVSKYVEQLKTLLYDLHKFKMSDDQWRKMAYDVSKKIAQKEAQTRIVITYSNENGQTRFDTDAYLKDTEAIIHALNTFSSYFGTEPSLEDIESILARSCHATEKKVITKRLDYLKKSGMILKSKRMPDPKAIKNLKEKFAIIIER